MGNFDQIKSLQEEVSGMANVMQTLNAQVNHAERRAGEEQANLDALLKLQAYAKGELARKRAVLYDLVKK